VKRDTASYRARLQVLADAESYATRFERGARRRIDRREQQAVRAIFARLPDCTSILDVPCGTGRFLPTLAASGRRVTEMDVAAEALHLARRRARDLGLEADFQVGDAAKLPLLDAQVDAVFCNRLLHHIARRDERAIFLREFQRVSRHYVVVSFFDYRRFGRLRIWLKRLKGRRVNYAGQPTLPEFLAEAADCGLRVRAVVPTGPIWVAQKYLVLEKAGTGDHSARRPAEDP
jgi:SAM-dependent methyltransferase